METKDLTIEILKGIRDEGRKTTERLERTNELIEQLDDGIERTTDLLDKLGEDLSLRLVESELRTAAAIADLAGSVRALVTVQ